MKRLKLHKGIYQFLQFQPSHRLFMVMNFYNQGGQRSSKAVSIAFS